MHPATVDLLVSKANLEIQTAVAIAEAMDTAISNAQLVTVPILDARIAPIDVKLATLKSDLILWIIGITVGNNYLPQIVSSIIKAIATATS